MIVKILTCLWSISVFTVSVISEIDSSGMVENNKYPCTYLIVSLSPSQQQQGKLKLHCTLKVYISVLYSFPENGRGSVRFGTVSHLMTVKHDIKLINVLTSVSCMVLLADVSIDSDVSILIDILTSFKVAWKSLIITVPELNNAVLENKTINFNVEIYHKRKGNRKLGLLILRCLRHCFNRWEAKNYQPMSSFGKSIWTEI